MKISVKFQFPTPKNPIHLVIQNIRDKASLSLDMQKDQGTEA